MIFFTKRALIGVSARAQELCLHWSEYVDTPPWGEVESQGAAEKSQETSVVETELHNKGASQNV